MAFLAGVLLTHAYAGRPQGGDWEYHLYAIGLGYLPR